MNMRQYSGILIYINRALIRWYINHHNTIEASSFGYEIICGCIACEKAKALTYKVQMSSMRVEGPANMYVENESVVKSVTMPKSRPKKKNLSI